MPQPSNARFWLRLQIIAILAAVVYSSWPLGYWLNPAVSRNSLASGLEAIGQPYNWLFIGGDVLSGLLILVVGWQLWLHYLSGHRHRYLAGVVLAAVGFGVGTIVDALLPERCVPNLQVCPNFTQDHLLLVHGMFSILAALVLFVSLAWLWWRERSNYLLNLLMVGYIVFGIISLLEAVQPGNTGNWSQHYYITLSSVWLAVLPPVVHRSLKRL